MTSTIESLIARLEWAARHDLSEVTIEHAGETISISRHGRRSNVPSAPSRGASTPQASAPQSGQADDQPKNRAIISPFSGICSLAQEDGKEPFIRVNDRIEKGQTVCFIEAMKMMTAITSEFAGTVTAIFVEDGADVSAGTKLMEVAV